VAVVAVGADPPLEALVTARDEWAARWPDALAVWSPYTRLRPPTWCLTADEEERAALTGSFAMIRLVDQAVVVSVRQVVARRLEQFPVELLAHEIGHHILCPADLSDNARMLARVRRSLPTVEHHAPLVANLYADLLINDRLQRRRGLDMAGVYRTLAGPEPATGLWAMYLRTYEILWSLGRGALTAGTGGAGHPAPVAVDPTSPTRLPDDRAARIEADAVLGARLVRAFARDWLRGAGRFAALCLPHLLDEQSEAGEAGLDAARIWQDAVAAGQGGLPDGLTGLDADEAEGAVHPALDPALNGTNAGPASPGTGAGEPGDGPAGGPAGGQYREPFEYGQILRATGLELTDHEVACRYYRERAAAHLIRFPVQRMPAVSDPLPEGVETWDVGSPLADIDWTETVLRGPRVIPGVTTVQRVWGTNFGADPEETPVDLDLYVDSSGSMPHPQLQVSHLALAGAIVALSALRAGGRVQATLWSGTREFTSTPGFVRDERAVLSVLTGHFGGGTAFPIHVLRDTYERRAPTDRSAHVLVVSDDGVTTLFDRDEQGRDGREVVRRAIAAAGGGATMVLNLWRPLEEVPGLPEAVADGWDVHVVRDWAELVTFARAFSRRRYEP
jgi:hypothetical protein